MGHNQQVIVNAKANLPTIQDALRSLFTGQSFDTVNSTEGKKGIQSSVFNSFNALLTRTGW